MESTQPPYIPFRFLAFCSFLAYIISWHCYVLHASDNPKFMFISIRSTPPTSEAGLGFLVAFDILYVIGLISLATIFLTALLSKRVHRQKTWFMVIISWVLNSVSNILLIGRQKTPLINLNPDLCLTQAVLIDSTPVLWVQSIQSGVVWLSSLPS